MVAEWDAGDMGCGELVLELRARLDALSPGQVITLVEANDKRYARVKVLQTICDRLEEALD